MSKTEDKVDKAIEELCQKVMKEHDAPAAMQFSQAVLNLSNAKARLTLTDITGMNKGTT